MIELFEWFERRLRGYTDADAESLRRKFRTAFIARRPLEPLTRWECNAHRARRHMW